MAMLAKIQAGYLATIPFFSVSENQQQRNMACYGGEDIADAQKALPDPLPKAGNDVYKVLIHKINKHFMPKQNKGFTRFRLGKL